MRRLTLHILLLLTPLITMALPREATTVADSLALSTLSSQTLMDRGRAHFGQHQAQQALACFNAVISRETGDDPQSVSLRIRALNNAACVYKYFFFDNLRAYAAFTEAYTLCETTGDDAFLPVIMVNMGDLFNDYSTYGSSALTQQAQETFEHCMEHAMKSHNWELMATAFFNLANQNYDLPLAKYRFIFSDEIPDSTPDLQYIRLQYQGLQCVQQHDYEQARIHFHSQLPAVSARWEPERDSIATYLSIAHTYKLEADYPHETEYLQKALQLANNRNITDQAIAIGHLLTQSQANDLADRQTLQQMVIITIGVILVLILAIAILLFYKNRQLHSRNRTLYQKNQQLLQAEDEKQQLRQQISDEGGKYSRSNLSSQQKDTLVDRIKDILDDPDSICQPDFTLAKLAKQADSNTTYVSQVINEHYGTSFSNVLSGCRIREACRRMSDESGQYSHITIEAISTGVGFKSRTAFINAFKREVGLTPSEYLRMAADKAQP